MSKASASRCGPAVPVNSVVTPSATGTLTPSKAVSAPEFAVIAMVFSRSATTWAGSFASSTRSFRTAGPA